MREYRENRPCLRVLLLLAVLAFAALTGCSRAVVMTEVQKDGTWTRTLKFYANAEKKEGAVPGGPALSETLDSAFVLTKGPGWKTSRALDKTPGAKEGPPNPFGGGTETEVYTAERTMALGEAIDHDISLKSDDPKMKEPIVVNTVSVKEVAPGRFLYREILRWKGPKLEQMPKTDLPISDAKMLEDMKKALPPELVTPEKSKVLTQNLMRGLTRLMFGPNDPLIADLFKLLMFPDLAEPKLLRSLNMLIDTALEQTYGDALPLEKRREITRKLAQLQTNEMKTQMKEKASTGPPDPKDQKKETGTLVAMTYRVRMPGRIVEANGEIDPISNEVYWTFYSPAPIAGDVELRAVCDMNLAQ